MELSSGYIWGLWQLDSLCSLFFQASCISLGCQCSKKKELMNRATSDSFRLSCTVSRIVQQRLLSGDHKKKRLLQANINTQLFITLQKIQCRQVLHLFNTPQMCTSYPKKNRHYRPIFMIQALFCPEFNQFLYKQLGSLGSFMSFSSKNADQ